MSYTAAFGAELDSLGIWWPRGNADALRSSAGAWAAIADVIDDVAAALDHAQASAVAGYRGHAAERLSSLWAEWSGADGYLAATAADCRRLAAACDDFGGDIDQADRTLLRAIETVFGGSGPADPAQIEDLRAGADRVGDQLETSASVRAGSLDGVGPRRPRVPLDRSPVDPQRVSWVDPGRPDDLTFLIGDEVDLGSGQGALFDGTYRAPSDPGMYGPTEPTWPAADGGGCLAAGCTCPACAGGMSHAPAPPDGTPLRGDGIGWHESVDGGLGDPFATDLSDGAASDAAAFGGGDATGGAGALGGGGGWSPSGSAPIVVPEPLDASFDAAPSGSFGLAEAGALGAVGTAAAVPISMARPSSVPLPPFDAAAATSTAAAAGGRSGRMPFVPMMPMMGSANSDGDEPTRRKQRPTRWPHPA